MSRLRRWLTRSRCRHTPECSIVIKFIFRPSWQRHCCALIATRVWSSSSSHSLFVCYSYLLSVLTTIFPAVQFPISTSPKGKLLVNWSRVNVSSLPRIIFTGATQVTQRVQLQHKWTLDIKSKTAMWAGTSGPLRTGLWKQHGHSYYITSEGMLEHCRRGLLDDLTNSHSHTRTHIQNEKWGPSSLGHPG